ncbi:hypothetical protein ACH4UM_00960 [Streptomyces sp. NPDC020801]|uniref:hypothetical protein n=1 Tax=Streptomyces sp. NPDC020801 TaxID=3365093 RepID=UPI0037983C61
MWFDPHPQFSYGEDVVGLVQLENEEFWQLADGVGNGVDLLVRTYNVFMVSKLSQRILATNRAGQFTGQNHDEACQRKGTECVVRVPAYLDGPRFVMEDFLPGANVRRVTTPLPSSNGWKRHSRDEKA